MRFVTNRIYTGKPTKSVADLVKEAQARNAGLSKTASTKEANMNNFKGKEAKPFKPSGKKDEECEETGEGEEKDECVEASTEVEIKIAKEKQETYDAGKKEGTEFTNKDIREPKDADVEAATGGDKKPEPKKGKDGLPESGQPQWEGKSENNNNPWKDPKAKDAGSEQTIKVSVPDGKYVVVANLKPELKARTREYWLALYPADYVDAMLADK